MDTADHLQRLAELHAQMDQVYLALGVQSNHKPQSIKQPPQPVEPVYKPFPGIACHCPCDFRDLPVETGSVSLVCTDIPYERPWLFPNAADLAHWCNRVLKPGGVMVTWYSQHHLDECLAELGKHLHFQWLFVSPLYGTGSMRWLSFIPRYQLALVYSKGEKMRLKRTTDDFTPGGIADLIPAGEREKSLHKHQKTVCQMQYLVEAFSEEGSLICDPCAASWTTAEACYLTNRRFVGSDISPQCLVMAQQRFASMLHQRNEVQ